MTVPTTRRATNAFIGSPIERLEDLRFLTGRGQYTDDLTDEKMLHAVILRSSVAHGRIRSIDTAAARARPGVHAVITAADIGEIPTIPLRHDPLPSSKRYVQPIIAADKVRFVGEPIAVVVADSVALAEDALEAIVVDIEPLAAVVDRDAAREAGVFLFEETGSNVAAPSRPPSATPTRHSRMRLMSAASISRCSATARCRWSRAGSSPIGTGRNNA
jgi:carbon-monoxide dehydrogenase large subunit